MFPPVHIGIFIICKDPFRRHFWTHQGVSWSDYASVFAITCPCSESCRSPPQPLPLPFLFQPDNCPCLHCPCWWRQGSMAAGLTAEQSCPWAGLQQLVQGSLCHRLREALWVGGEHPFRGALSQVKVACVLRSQSQ